MFNGASFGILMSFPHSSLQLCHPVQQNHHQDTMWMTELLLFYIIVEYKIKMLVIIHRSGVQLNLGVKLGWMFTSFFWSHDWKVFTHLSVLNR